MNKALVLTKKSIMYKITSLGYPVYLGDEEDEFLITTLVCSNCSEIWSMSRSECIFCGTENPHIYECRKCGTRYPITISFKKCCGEELVNICINDNCITNQNEEVRKFFDSKGGVFKMKKSGATLNEMRCKKCGNKENEYKSIIIKLVGNLDECNKHNKCYLNKIDESNFEVKYNNQKYHFTSIEEMIKEMIKR